MKQKEQTKEQTIYEKILVEELRNCVRLRKEWRMNSTYAANRLLEIWSLYIYSRRDKSRNGQYKRMFTACYSCLLRSGWHRDSPKLMESFGVLQCKNTDCPYYKAYKEMLDYIYANLDTEHLIRDLREVYSDPKKHLSEPYRKIDEASEWKDVSECFWNELEKFAREQGEAERKNEWRRKKQFSVWEDYLQNTGNTHYLNSFKKCYNCEESKSFSPESTFGVVRCDNTDCRGYKEYMGMRNHIYANLDIDTLLL